MSQQTLLFDDVPVDPGTVDIVLRSRPGRKLTPAQRTFNRRVERVEKLRADLKRQVRRLENALDYHAAHIRPRLERITKLRKELVRALAPFLGDRRLKRKADREALEAIVSFEVEAIVAEEGKLADEDLRAVFERVNGLSIEEAEREDMELALSAMEEMLDELGIDVDLSGLRPDMSDEEFAAATAEINEEFRRKAAGAEEAGRNPERPRNARERAKEARVRQAEALRKKSVGSVYKRLAKVLHPDLEPDAERRLQKVALMQQLTTAYHGADLHTLLSMELEWVEGGPAEGPTADQLKVYNDVLRDQIRDLEREIHDLPYQPRYCPLLDPEAPIGFEASFDGKAEVYRLDRMIADMETSLEGFRSRGLRAVRAAIREFKAAVFPV